MIEEEKEKMPQTIILSKTFKSKYQHRSNISWQQLKNPEKSPSKTQK